MTFIADLHIHSKYSRATAKNLDFENLYIAAQMKGITVVGTGDFTHPGWFEEITTKLEPAEEGLFQLKKEIANVCDQKVPNNCRIPVRFMLTVEISNIYKKNDRTRKNHNLVFMPNLDAAKNFNAKLGKIGNINSDGRPILGLDARNLLELTLETAETAYLIPAHIWTPWFSLLGSKSGFDSIEECFEDLTPHIFAAETGLSSDPPMNRLVSGLDGITLVSNSDAHSPMKLGREANIFDTDLSYPAIRRALISSDPDKFSGTYEFYPEEGKYHLDGHRKCNIRFTPENSRENSGKCPVCGKSLTLGVLYRVEELADRKDDRNIPRRHPFHSLIPLEDILSEVFKVGPKSKKVRSHYQAAIENLGPEFRILHTLPIDRIEQSGPPLMAEAIQRMRARRVHIAPGFDGEFGKIKIFSEEERQDLLGQKLMFAVPEQGTPAAPANMQAEVKKKKKEPSNSRKQANVLSVTPKRIKSYENAIESLNPEQKQAIQHGDKPLLIVAGPGTGKTRTLTIRIAHLIRDHRISPHQVLALTFTNKAAGEMRERLRAFLPETTKLPLVSTFHALCLHLIQEIEGDKAITVIDEDARLILANDAIAQVSNSSLKSPAIDAKGALERISLAKQFILAPHDNPAPYEQTLGLSLGSDFFEIYKHYQTLLNIQNLIPDMERVISYMPNGIGRQTLMWLKQWCYRKRYDLQKVLENLDRFPASNQLRRTFFD